MAYSNTTGFPSSTTILKPWMDTRWFKDEHRERGTAVHNALSAHIQGLWFPPLKAEYQGWFDSGKRWIDLMVDKVVLVEERMIDKALGYCGKPDLLAVLRGDKDNCLVDWKTAQAQHKTWKAQIASYRNLVTVEKEILVLRGMSVRLKKNGSMPIIDEYPSYQNDFNAFKSALTAHKYFK